MVLYAMHRMGSYEFFVERDQNVKLIENLVTAFVSGLSLNIKKYHSKI